MKEEASGTPMPSANVDPPTAPVQEIEASIGALMRAARALRSARAGGAKRSSGIHFALSRAIPELSAGEVWIAVADAHSVTLRCMDAPGDASVLQAEQWATRVANIELAVAELARAGLIPESGRSADRTEHEDRILEESGFDLAESDSIDPISRATAEYAVLVSDSYSTEEAAQLLGVNSSRIRQRVAGEPRTLLGIKLRNAWRIPRFQFDDQHQVPGLEKVIAALPSDLHPVAVYRWFTAPSPDLVSDDPDERPVTPITWLTMGNDPDPVAELASKL